MTSSMVSLVLSLVLGLLAVGATVDAADALALDPVVAREVAQELEQLEQDEEAEPRRMTTAAVQGRLRALGYLLGTANGSLDQQTQAAIMAFQRVHGLEVDGVAGPLTAEALRGETIEPELAGGPDDRIEVDLDLQLLHVVEGGERLVTLHVSSGHGGDYISSAGNPARARTAIGEFVIERRIHGIRHAPLGILHDPLYYHRGFAIHGAPSVPATPASAGCVRVSIADGQWLIDWAPDGLPVHLYGGEHVFTPRS